VGEGVDEILMVGLKLFLQGVHALLLVGNIGVEGWIVAEKWRDGKLYLRGRWYAVDRVQYQTDT
jgi:hypothetical protein